MLAARTGVALNIALSIFSAIWLIGHMTVRIGDWEFWFALLFTVAGLLNLFLFRRLEQGAPRA